MPKAEQVPCNIIKTKIHIMVGVGVTPEQLKKLDERLEKAYEDTYDDDDGFYAALVRWLESAGISGDFTVEQPDLDYYDSNRRPITGIW